MTNGMLDVTAPPLPLEAPRRSFAKRIRDNKFAAAEQKLRSDQLALLLDSLSFGALTVDETSRPIIINKRAQDIIEARDGISLQHGRLTAGSPTDTTELRNAIARASAPTSPKQSLSPFVLALKRQEGKRSLIVSVRPMHQTAVRHQAFRGAYLVICAPDEAGIIQPSCLCSAFGLTPTEARLAAELASGNTLEEAANTLGITIGTARVHLKHIFSKTETSRQSELVHLLLNSGFGLLK